MSKLTRGVYVRFINLILITTWANPLEGSLNMAPWLVKSYEPWDVDRYNFSFSLVKIQVISGLQAILGLGCDGTDRKIFKLYVLISTHVMKNTVM